MGKWDSYPVFCTLAHYLASEGHKYPLRIRVTDTQYLSINSPSFPGHLPDLTLPGGSSRSRFPMLALHSSSQEPPSSGTSCPGLPSFGASLRGGSLFCSGPCFSIWYYFWFWTHNHLGLRQIVPKKSLLIPLINSFKKYLLATCSSD